MDIYFESFERGLFDICRICLAGLRLSGAKVVDCFLFWFYDLCFRFVDEIQIKRNKRKRYALYECRYTIRLVWLWVMQFGYNEYENDDDANDDDVDNDNDDNEDG